MSNDTGAITEEQADAWLDRLLERAEERDDIDLGSSARTISRRGVLAALGGGAAGLAFSGSASADGDWGNATGDAGTQSKPFTDVWGQQGHFQSLESESLSTVTLNGGGPVSDGDGTERQIWVIANGASDPADANPEDIIFEEEN